MQKQRIIERVKSFLGYGSTTVGSRHFYIPLTGSRVITRTASYGQQASVYAYCAPVSSIINRKAAAVINARWWILDENNKEVRNSETLKIAAIMQRPNPLQNWKQFIMQAKIVEQVFGEVFILAVRPIGFRQPKSLWIIPNWMLEINAKSDFLFASDKSEIINSYTLTLDSERITISTEDIIHHKDIGYNSSDLLHGLSRLVSLQDPVSNIIAAYEARNVLITRKGAIGILSNDTKDSIGTVPLSPDERDNVHNDFRRYGITKNQWQVIITNASLKWQSMTFPTKDLMLFEEIEDDVRQVADNYGYPMHLLGFKAGTTFSNVREAKLSLYQDTIIPETDLFADTLNEFFGLSDKNYKLKPYFDHLDIFQKSQKELAEAKAVINSAYETAYRNGVVTLEEWRIALDYNPNTFTGSTFFQNNLNNQNNGTEEV